MSKKTNVVVTLQYQAVHQWENCDLEKVSFLKNKHRHIFHITAKKRVNHPDRDIEIIILKNAILTYFNKHYYSETIGIGDFGNMSCEQIANNLCVMFDLCYCAVLEDGENGAEVHYDH